MLRHRSARSFPPGCSPDLGQRRAPDGTPGAMNAAGYRMARRAMALAAELRLPLVTIVDTPGAELSAAAERRSEEHTSELQSLRHLVCRLLLEKKKISAEYD